MNPVAIRLLNQQLCCPEFNGPAEVVRHLGAVQAQECRLVRWAVAMRTKCPSLCAFRKAYDRGEIIRTHLMRGTWQLVTREDYWWMEQLCGDKARKTIKGWMNANHISIPDDERMAVRKIIEDTVGRLRSATKEEINFFLVSRGIVMDDHRLSYHIRFGELDCWLCSGDLHRMKPTYSLVSEKIGPKVLIDKDEALLRLTRRYFQSRQPATLEDYVWWSGLSASDCRRGMDMMKGSLVMEPYKGREFYLTDSCRTRGFRTGKTLFMAPYDEYLIGYKSRDIVLAPELSHFAHNNSGNFSPILVKDGTVCGNWSPFAKKMSCNLFCVSATEDELNEGWKQYCQYQER